MTPHQEADITNASAHSPKRNRIVRPERRAYTSGPVQCIQPIVQTRKFLLRSAYGNMFSKLALATSKDKEAPDHRDRPLESVCRRVISEIALASDDGENAAYGRLQVDCI